MIKVFVDGSARPNPGKGAIGVVIRGDGWDYSISRPLAGKVTNNQSEYRAIGCALEELGLNGLYDKEIIIYSDSRLVIEQLNGNWEVNKGSYLPEYLNVDHLRKSFINLKFEWVNRELNSEANLLASKGLRNSI